MTDPLADPIAEPITEPPRSSGRSSALVAAGIFLSRLLGLLRQSLIARYLGAGLVADAFNGAFRLTNFLQNLFGEGALSASFIPVYANALARNEEEEADRIAGAVGAILALVVAIIVLLGILAAPLVVQLVVGGFTGEKLELTIRLTRILFPGAGIFVLSAWCLGILNSHRRFFLSYVAPVFWNLAMIGALVAFGPRRGEVELAVILAWASVAGAVLQMAVQLPTVFRLLHRPRFRLDLAYPPVREAVRNFLPAFVSRGVVQLSGFIDIWLASHIPVNGVVTLLQNAQTIYVLPISLFGMSVSAAELPEMSRDTGSGPAAFDRLRVRMNAALPRVAFFVVPSAVGFFVLGEAIAGVLLQYGKFTHTDTLRTWAILAGSAVGLLASALGRLYSSTFYALRDTRTPLRFAIARVLLTGVLGYLFAFPLPRLLGLPAWTGAAGLTASAGIAGWVEFLLLRRAITARIGRTGIPPAALVRLWGAALLAGGAGWGVMQLVDPAHHLVRGIAAIVAFALVYGLATLALGVPEATALVRRARRR
ncbi:MAG TPA: murein biosynthesis integral membrane protein MurJ [Gemmatimonadaceae bacterium]|nr:murein biosynthesis integral membrane protein MurJ [Gemmatimonadaceae bacterium]